MSPWAWLYTWIALHLTAIGLLVGTLLREKPGWSRTSLKISLLATGMNTVTVIAFVSMFVVGRGSNVAQLAHSSGTMSLWSSWMKQFIPLLGGTLLALPTTTILVLLPPWFRHPVHGVARLANCGATWLTAAHLVEFAPTA